MNLNTELIDYFVLKTSDGALLFSVRDHTVTSGSTRQPFLLTSFSSGVFVSFDAIFVNCMST